MHSDGRLILIDFESAAYRPGAALVSPPSRAVLLHRLEVAAVPMTDLSGLRELAAATRDGRQAEWGAHRLPYATAFRTATPGSAHD